MGRRLIHRLGHKNAKVNRKGKVVLPDSEVVEAPVVLDVEAAKAAQALVTKTLEAAKLLEAARVLDQAKQLEAAKAKADEKAKAVAKVKAAAKAKADEKAREVARLAKQQAGTQKSSVRKSIQKKNKN